MNNVNKELVKKLKTLNHSIDDAYKNITKDKNKIRKKLNDMSELVKLQKLDLENYDKKIIVIDGSVNRVGGIFPHYVDLYQGYGIVLKGDDIILNDIYTPLLSQDETDEGIRDRMLAEIEIKVAINAARDHNVDIIIMDGSLIRYHIENEDMFKELRDMCVDRQILLAGFIKEIKTDMLYPHIFRGDIPYPIYDKDLLYGVLNIGESFMVPKSVNTKSDQRLCSAIYRMSNHPRVTGLDMLEENCDQREDLANLCYTLTAPMSRGVPAIIDIVDDKALLTNQMTEEIVKTYIDRDIYERFFITERDMRKY